MVREEDQNQKKGWFSRKKKNSFSSAASPKVSRPPSAASFGHSRNKATSNPSTPDDELPPRENAHTPLHSDAQQPNTVELNAEATRSSVELPKHAGFDLSAIKEIIGKAEQNTHELQAQDPSHYPVPHIPLPTHRSESAPPPLQDSPSTTPVMRSSLDLPSEPESVAGPSSRLDLNAVFQRSMSVNDLRDNPDDLGSPSLSQDAFSNTSYSTPRPSPPPSLPSAGYNSKWAAEPATKSPFGSRSFGPSTDTLSFGNQNGSITPYGSSFAPPTSNPFASVSSTGMSFGGSDGSITFSPAAEAERDPWDALPPQSKPPTYNSNPWQS